MILPVPAIASASILRPIRPSPALTACVIRCSPMSAALSWRSGAQCWVSGPGPSAWPPARRRSCPRRPTKIDDLVETIREARLNGRTHYMIVVAEGVGNTAEIVQQIKEKMGIEVRLTVLGHIPARRLPDGPRPAGLHPRWATTPWPCWQRARRTASSAANPSRSTMWTMDQGLEMTKHIDPDQFRVLRAMTR